MGAQEGALTHPSYKCDIDWEIEVLSFQVADGLHSSNYREISGLPHHRKGLADRSHSHARPFFQGPMER